MGSVISEFYSLVSSVTFSIAVRHFIGRLVLSTKKTMPMPAFELRPQMCPEFSSWVQLINLLKE